MSGPLDAAVSARIDSLRVVLVGLIVVCHGGRWIGSDIPVTAPWAEFCLTLVNRGFACLAVPLFFAISGFLLLRRLDASLKAYGRLLRTKAMAIGIPFLLFNAVWIVWLLTVGSIDRFGSRSFLLAEGIPAKLVGWGAAPLNYPLWFLRDLLVLFALSPVFLFCCRRLPMTGLVGMLAWWFVGAPTAEYSLPGFAFAFYAGGLLARRQANLRDTDGWEQYVLPAFLILSLFVGLQPWLGLDARSLAAFKKVYQVVGVAAFWCLSRYEWIMGGRLLRPLAGLSFFVFLTHEPTVSVLQSRLQALWRPVDAVSQILAYPVVGLCAFLGLAGLGLLLANAAPRLFAVLNGSPLRRRPASAIVSMPLEPHARLRHASSTSLPGGSGGDDPPRPPEASSLTSPTVPG